MWVQTLAPDGGTDPGDASRVRDQRGLLLLTNAFEKQSPDALPCSDSRRTWRAACNIVLYCLILFHIVSLGKEEKKNPAVMNHHSKPSLNRSVSLDLFCSVQQLFPVK